MNVKLYRIKGDCWRLVNDAGDVCAMDDMPTFFETCEFKSSDGTITQWKILFFESADPWLDAFEYFGELYKP